MQYFAYVQEAEADGQIYYILGALLVEYFFLYRLKLIFYLYLSIKFNRSELRCEFAASIALTVDSH